MASATAHVCAVGVAMLLVCTLGAIGEASPSGTCTGAWRRSGASLTWESLLAEDETSGVLLQWSNSGNVPTWLGGGSLFRIVPAQWSMNDGEHVTDAYRHYFDGLAMIVKFEVQEGGAGVLFSNKFIESEAFVTNNKNNSLNFVSFGTPAHPGLLPPGPVPLDGRERLEEQRKDRKSRLEEALDAMDPCERAFRMERVEFVASARKERSDDDRKGMGYTDNYNVNVEWLGDYLAAVSDVPSANAFDPVTLATIGPVNFTNPSNNKTEGDGIYGSTSSGHPHYNTHPESSPDPVGTIYNHAEQFGPLCHINILKTTPAHGGGPLYRESIGKHQVPCSEVPYMHSFALTEHYIVLSYVPEYWDLALLIEEYPITDCMAFNSSAPTQWLVFDRVSGEMVWSTESPAVFMWHHANAYEDADTGEVVVDLVTYPDDSIKNNMYLDVVRHCPQQWTEDFLSSSLMRYTLDVSAPANTPPVVRQLSDTKVELPRVNAPKHSGRSYQYVYGASVAGASSDYFDTLVKIDVSTGDSISWSQAGCYPSEAVFAAAPGSTEEDDGVLMAVVTDTFEATTFLLLLDAATMTELARAECPFVIPQNVHGQWAPSSA